MPRIAFLPPLELGLGVFFNPFFDDGEKATSCDGDCAFPPLLCVSGTRLTRCDFPDPPPED